MKDFITDCSHVFEAQYCVKMTGIFEGKLGTKRFCSSRDWGYYCEYIKRPGDIQVSIKTIKLPLKPSVHCKL